MWPGPTSRLLALLIGASLLSAPARSDTVYVDIANKGDPQQNGTFDHPFDAIQKGIDAAHAGDEVVVMPGTYVGPGNRDLDPHGKGLTVRSSNPTNPTVVQDTVIDCQAAGRGFSFRSGEGSGCLVAGLTITNGRAFTGGGIYCSNSSPTLMRCTIVGNTATGSGGGIHCYYSSPTIAYCTVRANHAADHGGGIDCFYQSHPKITNGTINENTAGDSGGGLYCYSSHPAITSCTIVANQAGSAGGGLYCCYNSSPIIANSSVIANTTPGNGGGVNTNTSSPGLINCTITGNQAAGIGGGIACAGGSVTIANAILWDNHAPSGGQIALGRYRAASYATVSYSDVQGGQPGLHVEQGCTLVWSGGNIDADPLLTDPDGPDDDPGTWSDNDYGLQSGSPCIDAGNNAAVPPDAADLDGDGNTGEPVPLDPQGHARFIDDTCTADTGCGPPPIVDIGAQEYRPADADADGVGDACDRCPGFNDLADNDHDGVADGCDDCLDTTPGSTVDERGCPPLIPCDFDRDGDVDEDDLESFHDCASAPMCRPSPGCEDRDLDRDNDVDQSDFGLFQRCLRGRGVAGNPDCAVVPAMVRRLSSLAVSGPDYVTRGTTARYTATATYDDGATEDVTTISGTTWSVATGPGSIENGLYVAPADIAEKTAATISATFVKDGIDKQDSKQISIVVSPPTAGPQPRVNAVQDTPIEILLLGSDEDGDDPLAFIIVSLPAHGTLTDPNAPSATIAPGYALSNNGRRVRYTPESGWSGTAAFEFKVNDGSEDSELAVCTITVHLPAVVQEGDPWTLLTLVPTEESQIPGGALRFVIRGLPTHGTLKDPNDPLGDGNPQDKNDFLDAYELPYQLTGSGNQVLYKPAPYYSGTDAFDYYATTD